MRVNAPSRDEITPWHRATLEAAPAAGIPLVAELNNVDIEQGIAIGPANMWNGMRWNAAFAYLDPVRARSTLTIRGNVLVDRVLVEGGRVRGLELIGPQGPARVETRRVVLGAGAYGSPLALMRSGIGDPEELPDHGIEVIHPLPGVGKNLMDHPVIGVIFQGTDDLVDQMRAFEAQGGLLREEGTIVKARSSRCRSAYDLHLYPLVSRDVGSWADRFHTEHPWVFGIPATTINPVSTGSIRLSGKDPEAAPMIDSGFLTDPDDRDLEILLDGIEIARSIAAQPALSRLVARELSPGPDLRDRTALREHVRTNNSHDYHPVGTCRMGPGSDPAAVVDARGRVHGLQGLYVADASIMPAIPRANTNIPALVVGLKMAEGLLAG
jgi:choline dehydrogenase